MKADLPNQPQILEADHLVGLVCHLVDVSEQIVIVIIVIVIVIVNSPIMTMEEMCLKKTWEISTLIIIQNHDYYYEHNHHRHRNHYQKCAWDKKLGRHTF